MVTLMCILCEVLFGKSLMLNSFLEWVHFRFRWFEYRNSRYEFGVIYQWYTMLDF